MMTKNYETRLKKLPKNVFGKVTESKAPIEKLYTPSFVHLSY